MFYFSFAYDVGLLNIPMKSKGQVKAMASGYYQVVSERVPYQNVLERGAI